MSKPQRLPSGSRRIRYLDHLGSRRSAVFATEAAARAGLRRAEVDLPGVNYTDPTTTITSPQPTASLTCCLR